MSQHRKVVLQWLEQGLVKQGDEHIVLQKSGVVPSSQQWQDFFNQTLLWLGVIFIGLALIFFFAYNWEDMGRYAQFGLAELCIVASLIGYSRFETDSLASRSCLLLASIFVGALLALVGQTYQTGADPYELFLIWALAILVWVVLAKLDALWIFFILLLNLAALLYFSITDDVAEILFTSNLKKWVFVALNGCALIAWEVKDVLIGNKNQSSWAKRILIFAVGSIITSMTMHVILRDYRTDDSIELAVISAYFIIMGLGYAQYRIKSKEIFALAGGVLSVILIVATLVIKRIISFNDAGSFLLIGLLIITMSGMGAMWLKKVINEVQS